MGKDTKKPKGFAMETPIGAIKVMVSEDEDNPGIVLAFVDKEGMERSYCMLEYCFLICGLQKRFGKRGHK